MNDKFAAAIAVIMIVFFLAIVIGLLTALTVWIWRLV